jgi:hypothetical protein
MELESSARNGRHWKAMPVTTSWEAKTEKKLQETRMIFKRMESAMISTMMRDMESYNRTARKGG